MNMFEIAWWRLLATFRLNQWAICNMSVGTRDYHDWPDESDMAGPMHGYEYTCRFCGKKFTI